MVKRYVLGTDGSNDIIDEAGNVTDQFIIYGLAGDDDLSGGELNDWIYGGAGNDFLMGNGGIDLLYGDDGIDTLIGGLGNDRLYGGSGDDTLIGEEGADSFDGGEGYDVVDYSIAAGAVVADLVNGGSAGEAMGDTFVSIEGISDSMFADSVYGDSADNVFEMSGGSDFVNGRGGRDMYAGYKMFGGTSFIIVLGDAAVSYAATHGIAFANPTDGKGLAIEAGGTDVVQFDRLASIENIAGSDEADVIIGDGNDNLILTYGGDEIDGGGGIDTVWFRLRLGYDYLWNSVRADLRQGTFTESHPGGDVTGSITNVENVLGSEGSDVIEGDGRDNVLAGGTGDDALVGNGGSDMLWGGDQIDVLQGGAGRDWLSGGQSSDMLDGGGGIDIAVYIDNTVAITADLDRQTISGGDANGDNFLSIEGVYGTFYADDVTGSRSDDTIYGNLGDDEIDGCCGDDLIYGGTGAITFTYGDGNSYGLGDVSLYIDCETPAPDSLLALIPADVTDNDLIYGGAGNDVIYGEGGSDAISGDAGNDILFGGEEADILFGGNGDDILIGGESFDFLFGGAGRDTASYVTSLAGVSVSLQEFWTNSGGDAGAATIEEIINSFNSGLDATQIWSSFIIVGALSSIDGSGSPLGYGLPDILVGIENLEGSAFGDTLTGDERDNSLSGLDGNDIINGAAGDDIISGGRGGDIIDGGDGIDTLDYGGDTSGIDISLETGAAAGGESQGDVFVNFENVIGGSGDDKILGSGGANSIWGGTGSDNIRSGSGADYIAGGGDRDFLRGGADADIFAYTALPDSGLDSEHDVILDFSQAEGDVIDLSLLDAIAGGNDDAFALTGAGGNGAFTSAGQIRFEQQGGQTLIQGEVTGDGIADFEIAIASLVTLTAADFGL